MSRTRWLAAAALTMSAGLAAGCGGTAGSPSAAPPAASSAAASSAPPSPPSAAVLAKNIEHALAKATSFHAAGAGISGGQRASLDVSFTKAGDGSGTIQSGSKRVTFVFLRGKAYIKVSRALLKAEKAPASACVMLCGKWLEAGKSAAKSLVGSLGWSTFAGGNTGKQLRGLKVLGFATVNGQPAWKLGLKHRGTIYVAARGLPYLLRTVTPASQGGGQFDFTDWNSVTISPPPASKVVNLSQLGG